MPVRRFPVRGELDLASVPDLQLKLDLLIRATDDDLLFDCAGLTFIDSTGVAMFIYARQALEAQGRSLRVDNLGDAPRRVFEVLGLTDALDLTQLNRA